MLKKNFRIYTVIHDAIKEKTDKLGIPKTDYIRMVIARYVFSDVLFEKWCNENSVSLNIWEGQKSIPPFDDSTMDSFFETGEQISAWKEGKFLKRPLELKTTEPVTLTIEDDIYNTFIEKIGKLSPIVVLTVMFLMDLADPALVEWYTSLNDLEVELL